MTTARIDEETLESRVWRDAFYASLNDVQKPGRPVDAAVYASKVADHCLAEWQARFAKSHEAER